MPIGACRLCAPDIGKRGPVEPWIGLIGIIVGVAAGAVVTFITTRSRIELEQKARYDYQDLEQRAKFDYDLRNLRLPHYQALHHLSERLPREFPTGDEPTRADLLAIREMFHKWYFGPSAGGMFLTEKARERYFDLMNELQVVGARSDAPARPTAAEVKRLLDQAHDLRQQLRVDLGTAEEPKTTWTARGLTPAPPSKVVGDA